MNLNENPQISEILVRIKKGMIDYMSFGETSYNEKDVDECLHILHNYLDRASKSKSQEDCMIHVKEAVLALNVLNDKCDYELIETDQREDICEVIILAGNEMGFNTLDEDITEEWRDW